MAYQVSLLVCLIWMSVITFNQVTGCSNSCDCPLQRCCRNSRGRLVTSNNSYGPGTCQYNLGIPNGGTCDPACITCTCGETDGYVCNPTSFTCELGDPFL